MILLEARLANTPSAAHEARDLVAGLAMSLPDLVDDLILLVSELVTNSHRHAGLGSEGHIDVQVSRSKGAVRVEVAEVSERRTSGPRMREPSADGGWGLHIVDNLASRWGVEDNGARTIVWFEIEIANGIRNR